jgi:uncharacterized membrane protein YkvA (DUF1232 family)
MNKYEYLPPQNAPVSTDDLLSDLKIVAKKVNTNKITLKLYTEHGLYKIQMKSIKHIKNTILTNILLYQKLIKDKRTPKISKLLLCAAVAYTLSPIDLIPDFIPIIGYLDDLIIVPTLVAAAIRFIPKSLIADIKNEISAQQGATADRTQTRGG